MTTALAPPPTPSRYCPMQVVGVSGGVGTSTVASALGGQDLRVFTGRPGPCRGLSRDGGLGAARRAGSPCCAAGPSWPSPGSTRPARVLRCGHGWSC